MAACLGLATGIFKYGWRHSRFSEAWKRGGGDARLDEHLDAEEDVGFASLGLQLADSKKGSAETRCVGATVTLPKRQPGSPQASCVH